ncbi:actin-85C isoform X1 [Fukomys damarensis]|uniref:actin-85C isoform X1 n=1 Tax=Fukomys damarensis TaxID=885580 RepID=UPI00053F9625|nr:actin-85C isoform X1 [Fukomys damarensis]XP_010634000.1 actin-85C isoform X1 [Fukomys damarensis]XP_010634002.1 actin-85C isoform X1 [Fukomys damarensis]XP_010634003.1 actin-85C isoform X1 [Fukomys damarensis]XP_010634004.1 actin-85C isoform X1 [Fukomys damarensis]XP_010634005.1 actin-85C isoform X1 [Fukomys damarensis]
MDRVPIICDYGSGFSKMGFAGNEAPLAVFPTILGKLRHDTVLVGMEEEDWFTGDDAQENREKLILQYPISRGAVASWDNLEKIWHHSFYQVLRIAPEEHPLMVTEPPLNSASTKERVCQILFETFNVPALSLTNQGVLSLYASGQTSGTAIESGEGMTYFVPVSDGCPLHQSTFQLDVAGQDLTLYLLQLLAERGSLLVGTADREHIRNVKEKCCYVALDFDKEKVEDRDSSSRPQKFQLPDGQEISLGQGAFLCPEALFQNNLIGRSTPGIHMIAMQSITSCNPSLWKTLFSHIVLSGGTASCSGLLLRLQRELTRLVSPTIDVKMALHLLQTPQANLGDISPAVGSWEILIRVTLLFLSADLQPVSSPGRCPPLPMPSTVPG